MSRLLHRLLPLAGVCVWLLAIGLVALMTLPGTARAQQSSNDFRLSIDDGYFKVTTRPYSYHDLAVFDSAIDPNDPSDGFTFIDYTNGHAGLIINDLGGGLDNVVATQVSASETRFTYDVFDVDAGAVTDWSVVQENAIICSNSIGTPCASLNFNRGSIFDTRFTITNTGSTALPLTAHMRLSSTFQGDPTALLPNPPENYVANVLANRQLGYVYNEHWFEAMAIRTDRPAEFRYIYGTSISTRTANFSALDNSFVDGTYDRQLAMGYDYGLIPAGESVTFETRALIGYGETALPDNFNFATGIPTPGAWGLALVGAMALLRRRYRRG